MHRTSVVVGPLAILAAGIAAAVFTVGSASRHQTAPAPAGYDASSFAAAARRAVASAAPPADLDVDLDEVDPDPYVSQDLATGLAVSPRRSTWVLWRGREKASLRVTEESAYRDYTVWTPVWQHQRTRTFVGAVERDGTLTTLHLTSAGGEVLDMICGPRRVAIHGAGARLLPPSPRRDGGECAIEGVWRPARTYTIDALACSASMRSDVPQSHRAMLFAPAPGVEAVSVDSDCILQDVGLRRVLR